MLNFSRKCSYLAVTTQFNKLKFECFPSVEIDCWYSIVLCSIWVEVVADLREIIQISSALHNNYQKKTIVSKYGFYNFLVYFFYLPHHRISQKFTKVAWVAFIFLTVYNTMYENIFNFYLVFLLFF